MFGINRGICEGVQELRESVKMTIGCQKVSVVKEGGGGIEGRKFLQTGQWDNGLLELGGQDT